VALSAESSPGPHTLTVLELPSYAQLTFVNILMGEVFLCSGQSNMWWPMKDTDNFVQFAQEANSLPEIRYHTVGYSPQVNPVEEIPTGSSWKVNSMAEISSVSSVCYHFARNFYLRHKVPVGIVPSSVGGSPIERWMAKEITNTCENNLPDQEQLYNGMIHPILNYHFKGVIWYQGESNANNHQKYSCQLRAMVDDWRLRFQNNFVFVIVQLAGFSNADYRGFRIMQEIMSEMIPNAALASALDLGNMFDIHPRLKDELGSRVERAVSGKGYNYPVVYKGPGFVSANFKRIGENVEVQLKFDHLVGSKGLKLKPSNYCTTCCNNLYQLFDVIDSTFQNRVPEAYVIEGNTVNFKVWSPQKIIYVRYSYLTYAQCVVMSVEHNLPMNPFIKPVQE
jgi:sialate O-acetylesterase